MTEPEQQRCMVCGRQRPDDRLTIVDTGREKSRHCNDNRQCIHDAKTHRFFPRQDDK